MIWFQLSLKCDIQYGIVGLKNGVNNKPFYNIVDFNYTNMDLDIDKSISYSSNENINQIQYWEEYVNIDPPLCSSMVKSLPPQIFDDIIETDYLDPRNFVPSYPSNVDDYDIQNYSSDYHVLFRHWWIWYW